ncbi:MAG: 2-amino-4-hydroxy-6-hydroxymethyldihydropteridine diphosphokinase [Chitinispirillales bacterium]|jgi:2-amino-4-hydroxy-6-hydroxymethyldihydropteridine diphosphokinase|nr:2-amino-4-hydroxy-6-hydroxymethyldihydropteridine diphosphokinase [Chitinispirillales bacterium]
MTFTAISLGSNLGDRLFYIESMERALRAVLVDGGVRMSRVMETEPVGAPCVGQPAYLNRVVAGYYLGDAYGLLDRCLSIEADLGRTRPAPKAPRAADMDILLFGGAGISDPPRLIVPHPELPNRRFCIEGLMDIDPSIEIRVAGRARAVGELYENMGADVAAQKVSFLPAAG